MAGRRIRALLRCCREVERVDTSETNNYKLPVMSRKVEVLCPNGHRVNVKVTPTTKILQILEEACTKQGFLPPENYELSKLGNKLTQTKGPGIHPVCVYMQDDVLGEFALRERSLRSLGLTEGRAILRLVHRAVDEARLDECRKSIEADKARFASIAASAQLKRSTESSQHPTMDVDMDSAVSHDTTHVTCESMSVSAVSDAAVSKESRSEPVMNRDDPCRPQRVARSFDAAPETEAMDLSDEQQQLSSVTGPGMYQGMTVDGRDETCHLPAAGQLPFADFKFPESTRGMDLYHNELSAVQRKDFEPCDREKIVFSLDENIAMATADTDLPDDFFEVTESDVKMMYSDMQSKLQEELNKSLMTRSNRLAELEAKMAKYDRATIRVTFPDRMVLQGLLRPQETVFALQKFVMEHLEDKDMPFYLYTSPPKRVLKDSAKTLIEAGLVPMSVVYFGADTKPDHYLSCSVCEGRTSRQSATKVLMNNLPSTSAQQSEGASTLAGGAVGRTDIATTRGAKHSYDTDAASKVPKWFKIGNK